MGKMHWELVVVAVVTSFGATWLSTQRGPAHTVRTVRGEVWARMARAHVHAFLALGIVSLISVLLPFFMGWDAVRVLPLLLLACPLAGLCFYMAARANRRIVFSKRGVTLVGVHGFKARWGSLERIDATPGYDVLAFVFPGRPRVVVAGQYEGWATVMTKLPSLVKHDEMARKKLREAIKVVNKWREPKDQYPLPS